MLASAGLGSRRTCEQLIEEGRVTVNGTVAHLGQRADSSSDHIAVDGIPLPVREGIVYYLLNKPAGVVTSAFDPEGRPTVLDLVPEVPRVFPVGRLDIMSEGLLVLTNDGELAYQLTHPSFGVVKEYVVEVEGQLSREAIGRLRRGVELDDGPTARARVTCPRPARRPYSDPRRAEPAGAAHVRGSGPPRTPAGPDAHRPRVRPRIGPRDLADVDDLRGPLTVGSREAPMPVATTVATGGRRSSARA